MFKSSKVAIKLSIIACRNSFLVGDRLLVITNEKTMHIQNTNSHRTKDPRSCPIVMIDLSSVKYLLGYALYEL